MNNRYVQLRGEIAEAYSQVFSTLSEIRPILSNNCSSLENEALEGLPPVHWVGEAIRENRQVSLKPFIGYLQRKEMLKQSKKDVTNTKGEAVDENTKLKPNQNEASYESTISRKSSSDSSQTRQSESSKASEEEKPDQSSQSIPAAVDNNLLKGEQKSKNLFAMKAHMLRQRRNSVTELRQNIGSTPKLDLGQVGIVKKLGRKATTMNIVNTLTVNKTKGERIRKARTELLSELIELGCVSDKTIILLYQAMKTECEDENFIDSNLFPKIMGRILSGELQATANASDSDSDSDSSSDLSLSSPQDNLTSSIMISLNVTNISLKNSTFTRENNEEESLDVEVIEELSRRIFSSFTSSFSEVERRSSLVISCVTSSEKLLNYRGFLERLTLLIPCTVTSRIKIFFCMYECATKANHISILKLCSILSNGNKLVEGTLKFAENLVKEFDDDGDGQITWDEFRHAVKRQPFILDTFIQSSSNEHDATKNQITPGGESEESFLRKLTYRVNLSWAKILKIWSDFNEVGIKSSEGKKNMDQNIMEISKEEDVYVTEQNFSEVLFRYFISAEPDDGVLIRNLFSLYQTEHKNIQGPVIICRSFVMKLGRLLNESKLGISDIEDKAEFYFGLYNIDNDATLSRDEIYQMVCNCHDETSRTILEICKTLYNMDLDGDGLISLDEYLTAGKTDRRLMYYFSKKIK